jgi:anti-anti-sigma regulatory factor
LLDSAEGEVVYTDKQLVIARTSAPPGLSLSGAIDYYNADSVAAALTSELLAAGDVSAMLADAVTGNGDLHLDLTRLEFTDVTGIRALVRIAENAGDGRRLVLRGLPPRIKTVIAVVGWGDLPSLVIDETE